MSWAVDRNRITVGDGHMTSFPYGIRQAEQIDDILVVLLDVPRGSIMTENVFGISRVDGQIIWQIDYCPETGTDPANWYTEILRRSGDSAWIGNWNGRVVDVDVATGKILRIWTSR